MGASRSSSGPAPFVQLGYVTGAHGVRGAIRVKLFNVDSKTLAPGVSVRLCPREGDPAAAVEVEVERVAPKPGSELCRVWLAGVASRESADALRGSELWVDRDQLAPVEEDEFYLADLVGLAVVRRGQGPTPEDLGRVVGVTTNTAQALLRIELEGDEWLVPALEPFLVELALERGELVVEVDDAMLPERWQARAAGATKSEWALVSATLEFEVFTIFPAMVEAFVGSGLMGKAIARELVAVHCTDLREFSRDRHRSVDDAPFGGGAGMVMKPGPVVDALEHVEAVRGPMHRIVLTPSAPRFDQRAAERLASHDRIALLCGRYEGIDDRVREHWADECLSIGDFVLNGGEVAAAVIIEAVARLRESVLGNPESIAGESFADAGAAGRDEQGSEGSWRPGLVLEHPQYTRPSEFRGHAVPEVLLGGDHGAVEAWRRRLACLRTWALRPDLRPVFRLDQAIVLAVPADGLDASARTSLASLAAAEGVELALVGRDPRAIHGSLVKLRDLKQLQRSLRKRCDAEPWIVGVGPAAAGGPILGPRLILDVMAYERQQAPGPLILWLGPVAHPALAKRRPSAWLALSEAPGGGPASAHHQRLALGPSLIDISQPQAAPADAAALARATLSAMRAGGLLRSPLPEQDRKTSP